MHKTIRLFAGLTALFAMGSAQAEVLCPAGVELVHTDINDETGHTYEIYRKDGITWAAAAACANKNLGNNLAAPLGHLATVTSSSENQWLVESLLRPALEKTAGPKLTQSQVWLGGVRDAGAWRWVNNEGPFPGVNNGTVFANWAAVEGEPNNSGGFENWVALGRYSGNLSGWNDEGAAVGSIGGFIVEYDTPKTLGECVGTTSTSKLCTTIDGQTLEFPAGSFGGNSKINFTAFEFNDPRIDSLTGKCSDRRPLLLFGHLPADEQLTIPEYLCGSPKFMVVKLVPSNLNIFRGAVGVENDTATVLPGNLYQCADPIVGNGNANPDPQFQDVVAWQSTDPSLMLEKVGTGIYLGTATEATNGCGSTTGKVRTGSYFVIGTHIDFNLANDFPLNAKANYDAFFALTQYKLNLLLQSVRNARSALVIRNPNGQAMESQVRNAISAMNAGDPASALTSINQFLKKVNDSTYVIAGVPEPVLKYNYNGDHLMRGENIAFTLRVKVIPFKPVP
jgi:hypothetical protein